MKIDGVQPVDILSQYYYLDQMGLSTYFTPTAVSDNSGQRYGQEMGYRLQDLQGMLDKLNIRQNKYYIIRLLRRGDIMALLYYLEKEKLLEALKFFPRNKLIRFLSYLPKETLIKMLLWVMPLRTLLQFFPTEVIFNILRSKRLEVTELVKGFETMPEDMLQKLLMAITGRPMDKVKHRELLAMLKQLKKEQILEGMKTLPYKYLFEFICQEVKKDPELLMMIPKAEFIRIISTMPKPNLLELFRLLPEEMLILFLAQLQEKFLAMAAAQLDDKLFGQLMMNQFPDLIASLASAA